MDMDGHTDLQWRSYKTNPGEFGILVLWVVGALRTALGV